MFAHPLHRKLGNTLFGNHRNESFVASFLDKLNFSGSFSKNGVVFAHANIFARMVLGASLTNDDVSGNYAFAAKFLNT